MLLCFYLVESLCERQSTNPYGYTENSINQFGPFRRPNEKRFKSFVNKKGVALFLIHSSAYFPESNVRSNPFILTINYTTAISFAFDTVIAFFATVSFNNPSA